MDERQRRYHHGDLRTALIEAGLELARSGGEPALGLREVTRRVGVSPNAAYRHFADRAALVEAVSGRIQHELAAAMRRPPATGRTAAARARARLRGVGLGYVAFALAEPGWFSVVFFRANRPSEVEPDDIPDPAPPYAALLEALDALVAAGLLTSSQREGAQWPCWAAVHGFADLALHGPLRHLDRQVQLALAERTVDAIIDGLIGE